MPVFYFDIADGRMHHDREARDLIDKSHLDLELRRRLSEIILQGDNPLRALIKVRDEAHDTIATATISAAITYSETHH